MTSTGAGGRRSWKALRMAGETGERDLHRSRWTDGLRRDEKAHREGLEGGQDALDHQPPRSPSDRLAGRPERGPGRAGSPAAEVFIAGAGRKAWKAGRSRWKESCRGLHRRSWTGGLEGGQDAPDHRRASGGLEGDSFPGTCRITSCRGLRRTGWTEGPGDRRASSSSIDLGGGAGGS